MRAEVAIGALALAGGLCLTVGDQIAEVLGLAAAQPTRRGKTLGHAAAQAAIAIHHQLQVVRGGESRLAREGAQRKAAPPRLALGVEDAQERAVVVERKDVRRRFGHGVQARPDRAHASSRARHKLHTNGMRCAIITAHQTTDITSYNHHNQTSPRRGKPFGFTSHEHNSDTFIELLDRIDVVYPPDRGHIIMDNLSTGPSAGHTGPSPVVVAS
jgi:hypothetical protein